MASKWLLVAPVAGALGVGAGFGANGLFAAGEEKQDLKPAVSLPLTRVVLFNSGVGYFSRSGDVEGDARVDLTFPETDINDLLKSMVLEDFSKNGRISAVSYDSREPIACRPRRETTSTSCKFPAKFSVENRGLLRR